MNHYRRTQTEISERISYFENLVSERKTIIKTFYNEVGELLPQTQIIPLLPESYKNSDDPPEKILEKFVDELMENSEKLYFFELAKEYGKMMSTSSEGPAVIKRLYEIFETGKNQLKDVDKEIFPLWCLLWNNMFKTPN